MNNLLNATSLLLQEGRKDEMEFRYNPRPGPMISPEPEFHDVEQSQELFDIDPDTTLLVSAENNIEDFGKEMQNYMVSEFNRISSTTYSDILMARRPIRPKDFQDLTAKCIESLTEVTDNYCKTKFTPKIVDLLDVLLSSMRESLIICKRKIAQKLINIRDSMADHKRTLQLAFDHEKSEAIRITRNQSRKEFLQELTDLREHAEKVDFGNRVLSKKVDWCNAELVSKDAQIAALETKVEKIMKKSREIQQEAHHARKAAEAQIEDMRNNLHTLIPVSVTHSHTKPLCVDSFTQTVENKSSIAVSVIETTDRPLHPQHNIGISAITAPVESKGQTEPDHYVENKIESLPCSNCLVYESQIKVKYNTIKISLTIFVILFNLCIFSL
jgi:hypothetical protein